MDANDFVTKLKADSFEKYDCDLRKVFDTYKSILTKIPTKDRGIFALNVLRTLCWNIDKAPKWRETVDNASLLTLAIECVRETRTSDKEERAKTLACIYHVHRHAVRLNKTVPPELVLKISFMPFELDDTLLLKEYNKTYWNILNYRISYIERLKTKVNIAKLLTKLTEDIVKVIKLYNTPQFCSTIIVFVVKKLHSMYSEKHSKELSVTFKEIFSVISKKDDIELFKKLPEQEVFDVYMKLNDCLYIVADNSSLLDFKDGIFVDVVHTCTALVGHCSDLFHCLQAFYFNFFCSITTLNASVACVETILSSLHKSVEMAEELGYKKALHVTYPYLTQLFRLYCENLQKTSKNKQNSSVKVQENCLKLILQFMKGLSRCDQFLKCENCFFKTGLHDALRLSLLTKNVITICLAQKIVLTGMFDILNSITNEQYIILKELNKLGCGNYQKLFRKVQTDIHNSAIMLNKAQYYELSIKLFNIYLENELQCDEIDHKNISRAFFNKSICELDCVLYETSLIDAFLSLIYSQKEGLETDKYMSLVMDIKSKELKAKSDDDEETDTGSLQLISVLDACKLVLDSKSYGDLKPFISQLDFSVLLRHEFDMYCKLWPSTAPVAGVWRALHTLLATPHWISVKNEAAILQTLYDVVLETPSVLRTIHCAHLSAIVEELLHRFNNILKQTPEEVAVHAALLFLQCEYDLSAASQKYAWKLSPPMQGLNLEQLSSTRTVPQEHAALKSAITAERLVQQLLPVIEQVSKARLCSSLHIYQIFVPLLMQHSRDAAALRLARTCCLMADTLHDHESYLCNASILLSYCPPSSTLEDVITRAADLVAQQEEWSEMRVVFLSDVALYYISRGRVGMAARLVQYAQAHILFADQSDVKLDLAVGRLLEAQALLCAGAGPSELTSVNTVLRHYLAVTVTGTKWSSRRLRQLTLRSMTSLAAHRACALSRALGLMSRVRASAAAVLPSEGAAGQGRLLAQAVNVTCFNDAQLKIGNHLKRIIGLQPSNETHPDCTLPTPKSPQFIPKPEVETMRDIKMLRKNNTDRTLPWETVPAFKIPEFFHHNMKCTCYACEIPICLLLCIKTTKLEAATYSYANEDDIARNYYEGVLDMIKIVEAKLKNIENELKDVYEDFVVESVMVKLKNDFKTVQIESLIDVSFFELKMKNILVADEHIVAIHEIMQETGKVDAYLTNNVYNLMIASASLKKTTKKLDLDLDEFENLNLSPVKDKISPKTPEHRPSKPPKHVKTKVIVKDEELHKKRTIVKQIKLDEDDEDNDFEKPIKKTTRKSKKDGFKIPNPILPKPCLEEATPKPMRSIPKLIVSQISDENQTPNNKNRAIDFFTPTVNTPEQFFTPTSTIKTYTKKSLRNNIVKNLEQQFFTPKAETGKENKNFGETSAVKKDSRKEDSKKVRKDNSTVKEDNLKTKKDSAKEYSIKTRKDSSAVKGVTSTIKADSSTKKGVAKEEVVVKDRLNMTSRESVIRPRRLRKINLDSDNE